VGEVITTDFLAAGTATVRHRALAAYFEAQPLENRHAESRSWNLRKLVEMPFQQARVSIDQLEETLTHLPFLQAKVTALGPYPLIGDFEAVQRLGVLQDALRLAAHALAQRPEELRSQLCARLGGSHRPLLDRIMADADVASNVWLRPYVSSLNPAGGPLRETFVGMVIANDVLVSPDGQMAVCSDDSARLWTFDLRTGALRHRVNPPRGEWFTAAAMHPERSLAAFGSEMGGLWWIDVRSGVLARKRPVQKSRTVGLAFVDDGSSLAAMHENGSIVLHKLPPSNCHRRIDLGGKASAFTSGRDRWFIGDGANVHVWDVRAESRIRTLAGRGDAVSALALSADERCLAVGYDDGNVELLAADGSGRPMLLAGHREQPTRNNVSALIFTHDDARLVSTSWDETVRIWERASGRQLGKLTGHSMAIYGLALVPGTDLALTTSKDSTMRVWDLGRASDHDDGLQHRAAVDALAVSADLVVSGSRDRKLCVWDLATGEAVRRWDAHSGKEPHEGWIAAVALDEKTGTIHSAGKDGALRTWRLADATPGEIIEGAWGSAALALSHNGSVLLMADSSYTKRSLSVWSPVRGKKIGAVQPKVFGNSIGISPDGSSAVLCDLDGGFVVVDVARRKVLWAHAGRHKNSRSYFTTAALTDGGGIALLGGAGGVLEAWDLRARKRLWSAKYDDDLGAVAISPDGQFGCSGGWDRLLQVFNLRDGRAIASFSSDDAWSACAFGPDNRTLVAADNRGAVHFLRLEGRTT
jgi:WD40 repeat protein